MQGSLAEKLRVLRARMGLSLTEAAARAGVTRDTLSDLEHGKRHPYMPTLTKIAGGYGVPVEELLEEPVLATGKAEAPDAGRAGQTEAAKLHASLPVDGLAGEMARARRAIEECADIAIGLAAVWNQDVELYRQHGRSVQPYRAYEMSFAVTTLYRLFFGTLGDLQSHAGALGLDADPAAWDLQSKGLLIEAGSNICALAELYAIIDKETSGPGTDRENFRARREEFDAGFPPSLVEDPLWPPAVERARAAAGIA
jgi:transcriptional regulator with XRE-family HTH domain